MAIDPPCRVRHDPCALARCGVNRYRWPILVRGGYPVVYLTNPMKIQRWIDLLVCVCRESGHGLYVYAVIMY